MTHFLRTEKGRYVYEYECPICGAAGEIGVPVRCLTLLDHGCGALFIQALPSGMFAQPRLLEVISKGGNA